jgi:pSer/pThr/pTyr-binding forkhead associated (FHA) protein
MWSGPPTTLGVIPSGKLAGKEPQVTDKDKPDELAVEITSTMPLADFLNEHDALPTAGSASATSRIEGLPTREALLVVTRGPNTGSGFLLDQPTTTAGRHSGSDIFLDDVTVSRRHAEFRWLDDDLLVVDVGSLNGTYVNREPVESAVLRNGDEVQIGKFRLRCLRPDNQQRPQAGAGSTAQR